MRFKKRVGRSQTLFDIDDYNLLAIIIVQKNALHIPLARLKKELNLSHKALLIHLRRLDKYGLISVCREPGNYKSKLVYLTARGLEVFDIFYRMEEEA